MKDSCSLTKAAPADVDVDAEADADVDVDAVAEIAVAEASWCCNAEADRPKLTCDNIAVADNLPL